MSDKQEEVTAKGVKPKSSRNVWGRLGLFITLFGLIVFVGGFGYGYFQLSKINTTLASMVNDLQHQVTNSQTELTGVEQTLSGMQTGVQKSQELSAKQEQMIAGWQAAQKGDLSRWYVAEAQYLTRLANYNLELSHNAGMAIVLLQRAQAILQKIKDPSLDVIRHALNANLAKLHSQPQLSVEKLYLRMATVYNQLDDLPLPSTPLQPDMTDDHANKKKYEDAPWYKMQWHRTMRALRQIVIVRYNDGNEFPLIMPEGKVILYQNLHTQMEAAMWSVLNRNAVVYQSSLTHMIDWIQKYFSQDATATVSMLQQLRGLQTVNLQIPVVNVASTVQLFDQYMSGQVEQPNAAQ